MSLSGLAQQMESSCKVNDGKGDYFDLLGLPDEIIDRTFSFLDVQERMRMRLNKRLNKIESKSKYDWKIVNLDEHPHFFLNDGKYVIFKDRKNSLDFLERIAPNTSIGDLHVFFESSLVRNRIFNDLVKKLKNIKCLYLKVGDTRFLPWIMSNSLFLDFTGLCSKLSLDCGNAYLKEYFPSDSLYQVCKSMSDGSTILRKLFIKARICEEKLNAFLNLLGITCTSGSIISNRNIEVYKGNATEEKNFFVNIFDGPVHISFYYRISGSSSPYSNFIIELYENIESLNNAKSAASRVEWEWARVYVL